MWGFAPGILRFLALYGGSARAPLRVAVRAGIGVPFKGFGKRFCEKFVIRFYTVVSGFRKVFRVLYGCEETLDTNPNRRADSFKSPLPPSRARPAGSSSIGPVWKTRTLEEQGCYNIGAPIINSITLSGSYYSYSVIYPKTLL